MIYESIVRYTFDPPCSSALLETIRNHKHKSGRLVVDENYNVSIYDEVDFHTHTKLLGTSTLEFVCQEKFIKSYRPIYIDFTNNDWTNLFNILHKSKMNHNIK